MPTECFTEVFKSWDNYTISIKHLRMKAISLLALTTMLRPSDIAPKALHIDGNDVVTQYCFSEDQIKFKADGNMTIIIHGNKNDSKRHGFEIEVTKASDINICPIQTLKCYIDRTRNVRTINGPVFISLNLPYNGLSSQSVSNILNDAIESVGLSREMYSAKNFRPTGATTAVAAGIDPNIVQKVGRWKTTSVFFEHYVHSRTPCDFSDKVLKIK